MLVTILLGTQAKDKDLFYSILMISSLRNR